MLAELSVIVIFEDAICEDLALILSIVYKFLGVSATKVWGAVKKEVFAYPSTLPITLSFPAIVPTIPVLGFIFRITLFPESAIYTSTPLEKLDIAATPIAFENCVAVPIPFAKPGEPTVPAIVLTIPVTESI